jgi:hypothetical protein
MHYKNGREAKNGDKVVFTPMYTSGDGKIVYGSPMIGILYDAQAGNDHCNGKVAPMSPADSCPNLKECLHLEDVLKVIAGDVPDTSKAADPIPAPAATAPG